MNCDKLLSFSLAFFPKCVHEKNFSSNRTFACLIIYGEFLPSEWKLSISIINRSTKNVRQPSKPASWWQEDVQLLPRGTYICTIFVRCMAAIIQQYLCLDSA